MQIWDRSRGESVYTLDPDLFIEEIKVSDDGSKIGICGRDNGLRGILKMYQSV